MKRAQEFVGYMRERHQIYINRAQGKPAPWTEDEALQRIYLTNVFRELDKVTIWIHENIREPFATNSNLWHLLVAARLINHPPTLQALLTKRGLRAGGWDRETFLEVMGARHAAGEKIYTQAYMTWGGHTKGQAKYHTTVDTLDLLWDNRYAIEPRLHNTLQEAWEVLTQYSGLRGGFVAYEIVTDLRHTEYLRAAPDVNTWAFAGPGAKRGLNFVFGREPVTKSIKKETALSMMQRLLDYVNSEWPADWPELELREIEHSLCEFSKVMRYRLEGKTPKRWYAEGTGA